jgi:hypothetical protein
MKLFEALGFIFSFASVFILLMGVCILMGGYINAYQLMSLAIIDSFVFVAGVLSFLTSIE